MRDKDLIQDDITITKRKIDELQDEIISAQFQLEKDKETQSARMSVKLKLEKELEKLCFEFQD